MSADRELVVFAAPGEDEGEDRVRSKRKVAKLFGCKYDEVEALSASGVLPVSRIEHYVTKDGEPAWRYVWSKRQILGYQFGRGMRQGELAAEQDGAA